jgi:hypothetical protein
MVRASVHVLVSDWSCLQLMESEHDSHQEAISEQRSVVDLIVYVQCWVPDDALQLDEEIEQWISLVQMLECVFDVLGVWKLRSIQVHVGVVGILLELRCQKAVAKDAGLDEENLIRYHSFRA